ncbi:MAG: MFS transporter [Ilumatobacter sp.]|nr:MFS transporter [Ilumatobacter sp.]
MTGARAEHPARRRAFNGLWLGSAISNTGDGVRMAALPLLAVTLTTSPFLVASITTAQFLPWLVFGPIGGALVDRWRRRQIIIVVQLVRAGIMLALMVAVVADAAAIWQLYVVAFAITFGEILVDPATIALVPTLVERDELDQANGRIVSTEIVTNEFVGSPLGGAGFALAQWLPFGFDAASYASSTVAFARLPKSVALPRPASSMRADIGEGFRWLRHHPVLGPMTVVIAVFNFGAVAAGAMLVLLTTQVLGGAEATFGVILAVGAFGALLGSLAAMRVSRRLGRGRTLVGSFVIEGALLFAVSAAPNLPALFGLWFVIGVPFGVWMPTARTLQQRLTPPRLLGRVSTTGRMVTRGSMVVGSLLAGAIATATSVRTAISIGALAQLGAAAALWLVLRRHDVDAMAATANHDE